MSSLLRDARLAFRSLLKSPGFFATAIATLALCIGANLAIFAVVDAVLVRSLPFPQSDRLVSVFNSYPGAGVDRAGASITNYYDRRNAIKALSSMSLFQDSSVVVGGDGAPQRVDTARITPDFFSTLRVPLAMGHMFTDDQLLYGADQVAILTDQYWRNHFNSDPNVIGRTFLNDGLTVTVVGVLPRGFHFLSTKAQFYRPASHGKEDVAPKNRHNNNWGMIARLADGATLADAQAQMDAFNVQQLRDDPFAELVKGAKYHTSVADFHADYVRTARPVLVLLQAGVLFLLLIGGVNLVNLLLIRASGRSKEIAVRQALGAGAVEIARGVLAETLVLALAGGSLGLALGAGGIGLLRALGTDKLPLGAEVGFDLRLAVAAIVGSLVVAVLLAVPVIWFVRRGKLATVLQAESRSGTTTRAAQRLRHVFIVAQVALAFVLLSGAGLLGVSLQRVLATPPGFSSDGILTGRIYLPWKNYKDDAAQLAYVDRLLPALRALPGVTSVAIETGLPFGGNINDSVVTVEGHDPKPGDAVRAHYISAASADYWSMMHIPLLRGRLLEDADNHRPQKVCLVDQAFAERYWPGQDPIGHRLAQDVKIDDKNVATVVGVVGNVKQNELAETEGHGSVYFPYVAQTSRNFSVLVRSALPPTAMAPMVQKVALQLDPELPMDDLRPLQGRIDDTLLARRSPAIMAGIFAAVALILAAIGTYGVLSYAVSQRQREIGVRIALGALPEQIRNQFVTVGAKVLVAGAAIGVLGAWAAGHAMQTVLFGVPALHPLTLVAALVVMSIATLAAALIPAIRATRVNPMVALRSE